MNLDAKIDSENIKYSVIKSKIILHDTHYHDIMQTYLNTCIS